jgi:hypothetical protein
MNRNRRLRRRLFAVAASAVLAGSFAVAQGPAASAQSFGLGTAEKPIGLNINDLTTPLDVTGTPAFGWLPQDLLGDETQTAYDVTVTDRFTGQRVWSSGKVASSDESYVPYAGPALTGGAQYAWSVQTWNKQGDQSPAASSYFGVGLSDSQWSGAQWIRRPTTGNDSTIDYTLARKQVTLTSPAKVASAVVYLAAPMRSQLHVNGQIVDTQDDYQTAGENYYEAEDITSEAAAAQQAAGSAQNQLALGVQYAHWAAGEAHPEGPQPYSTKLAADAPAGSSTIVVTPATGSTCTTAPAQSAEFCGASYDWYVGETLGLGTAGTAAFTTDTIAAISGNTVTLATPLAADQPPAEPVTSENGPSGLLVKVVVTYQGGATQTIVSDGSWQVAKDAAELNTTAKVRSSQNAGDYVEYYDAATAQTQAGWDQVGYQPATPWQPAVDMGTAPLPNPPNCGNYSTANGANTAPKTPATATATPVLSSPCGFSNLIPEQAPVTYKLVHPQSVTTLPDGTAEADFGAAMIAAPVVSFPDATAAQAGDQVQLTASYRLAGTVTTAAAAAGDTSITVDDTSKYPDFSTTGAVTGFAVGDPITIDAPADGYGAGNPETDTITGISGATISLAKPLTAAHASGVWVQGSRVGTSTLDDQSTNLNFYYTQSGTPGETSNFFVPMGWQDLQIYQATAANGGQPLTTEDVWAVEQYNSASGVGSGAPDPGEDNGGGAAADTAANVSAYSNTASSDQPASVFTDAPASALDQAATFDSSNSELNSVYTLMERSALFSGQQAYEDSPDRQEGQFTGDATDESQAQIENLGERTLTRELIDDLIDSQQRWWIAGSPAQASTWGEISAIYPDNLSDNKRDIPDYTEMFPELVWDYYQATGDLATLEAAYPTMQNVVQYVDDSTPSTGQSAGLVCQLASFSTSGSYRFGIIDWPSTDRYNTVVNNSGVDTVINIRAVEDYRALADAAQAVGDTADVSGYTDQMNSLISSVNTTLVDPTGLYDDGMNVSGGSAGKTGDCSGTTGAALTGNSSQTDQTFAIAYGVAPSSSYAQLGTYIASEGMKQGPMDLGQLELALVDANQPSALVALLTNAEGDGPAKILAEGGTSMWEQWDPGCSAAGGAAGDNDTYDDEECVGSAISQSSSDSFSHGWGSVGAYPVTRGLLGITPTGVGGSTVDIEPPSSGLASASGSEWTERGQVSVKWTQFTQGLLKGEDTLTVTVPDNVQAKVSLPVGLLPYIGLGTGDAHYVSTEDGRATYTVGSGVEVFVP